MPSLLFNSGFVVRAGFFACVSQSDNVACVPHDIFVIAILTAALTHWHQSSRFILTSSIIIAVTAIMVEVLNIFALVEKELKA